MPARRTGQLSMMAPAMLGALAVWWMLNEYLLREVTGGAFKRSFRSLLLRGMCSLTFVVCSSLSGLATAAIIYLSVAALIVASLLANPEDDSTIIAPPFAQNNPIRLLTKVEQ